MIYLIQEYLNNIELSNLNNIVRITSNADAKKAS